VLAAWNVDAGDACHVALFPFLSALTLLVARVLAQHADHAPAAHDLALVTNLLDARSNLHVVISLLVPFREAAV
jgi:hypothetical protein